MTDELDDLVRSSANFGYLAEHEPVLAFDGASAEAYIYSDPDAAMFKARRFLEGLSKKAVMVFGVHTEGRRLYDRVIDLRRAGVIDADIQDLCDQVRTAGNQAVHGQLGDVHAALQAVQRCFDLGLWLHNTILGGQEVKAFIPPRAPTLVPSTRDVNGSEEAREIGILLGAFERRLGLLESQPDDVSGRSAADRTAAVGTLMALQASLGDAVRSAGQRIEDRLDELTAQLDERLANRDAVSGSRHDELLRNAASATELLKREAEHLHRITQEATQQSDEDSAPGSTSVFNVAGDKSTNFVIGNVYGSTVNPRFGKGR